MPQQTEITQFIFGQPLRSENPSHTRSPFTFDEQVSSCCLCVGERKGSDRGALSGKESGWRVRAKTIVAIAGDRGFESTSLHRRVRREPDSVDRGAENIAERDSVTHYAQ